MIITSANVFLPVAWLSCVPRLLLDPHATLGMLGVSHYVQNMIDRDSGVCTGLCETLGSAQRTCWAVKGMHRTCTEFLGMHNTWSQWDGRVCTGKRLKVSRGTGSPWVRVRQLMRQLTRQLMRKLSHVVALLPLLHQCWHCFATQGPVDQRKLMAQ